MAFSTKCVSLRLSNFASLRDSFGAEKWHYLACYFLGNQLVKFDERFNFTSNMLNYVIQSSATTVNKWAIWLLNA